MPSLEHAWAHTGLENPGPFFEDGETYDRIIYRQRPILGRACTSNQPMRMYHRPDSAVRAVRRAVCVLPRGRVGARTGSPRSRAILLSTLARYITDRVTLWSERPKKKTVHTSDQP